MGLNDLYWILIQEKRTQEKISGNTIIDKQHSKVPPFLKWNQIFFLNKFWQFTHILSFIIFWLLAKIILLDSNYFDTIKRSKKIITCYYNTIPV